MLRECCIGVSILKTVLRQSALAIACLSLVGCGGSGSDSGTTANNQTATIVTTTTSVVLFSLGLSDAPVDDAVAVYIELDSIKLSAVDESSSTQETIIETFTDINGMEVETVQVNLLDYQGSAQLKIIDEAQSIELEPGVYDMELSVIDEGSYVLLDNDATEHDIKVPSSRLRLGEFNVSEAASQVDDTPAYTIEFDLRKSLVMRGNANNNNGFIIKPHGVRIASLAGTIAGEVAADFTNLGDCYIYLYDTVVTEYGDMFDPEDDAYITPEEEVTASAPLATTKVGVDGTYEIAFLQPNNYQVALSCGVEIDDNVQFDGLTIPSAGDSTPEVQIVEVFSGEIAPVNF